MKTDDIRDFMLSRCCLKKLEKECDSVSFRDASNGDFFFVCVRE